MGPDHLHLDTTVQLSRIAYGGETSRSYNAELAGRPRVSTTSLVYREFLRTLVSDIEYLHGKAEQTPADGDDGFIDVGSILQSIGAAKDRYSSRSIRRLHLVAGQLLRELDRTRVPKIKILRKLERIASAYSRMFFTYPDESGRPLQIELLTGLEQDPAELDQLRAAAPFPRRPGFPAGAARFLAERLPEVETVAGFMEKAKSGAGRDDRLLDFLRRLMNDDGRFDFPRHLPRYKEMCWRLGDLLIALECPDGAALYATDRAFPVLARALGLVYFEGYGSPKAPAES
ncbi:MAG: hypothetical protein AAFY88_18975 [Acidobacteriota bacterium]